MASQTNQLENIYNENVAIDDAKFKEQRGLISSLVRDTLIPQVMDKFTYLGQGQARGHSLACPCIHTALLESISITHFISLNSP